MSETSIEWTDHSINPVRARNKKTGAVGHYCEKIAQGCANCYSSNFQKRFGMPPFGSGQHRDEVEIFLDESKLEEVRRRKKPTKYFWCDMTDIFGDWMEREWLVKCFATMDATPWHTHQLLTKRPENIQRMWPLVHEVGTHRILGRYRHNVWLGTSISIQSDADRNIPALLKCREMCGTIFVSAEPLIESVNLTRFLGANNDARGVGILGDGGLGGFQCGSGWPGLETSRDQHGVARREVGDSRDETSVNRRSGAGRLSKDSFPQLVGKVLDQSAQDCVDDCESSRDSRGPSDQSQGWEPQEQSPRKSGDRYREREHATRRENSEISRQGSSEGGEPLQGTADAGAGCGSEADPKIRIDVSSSDRGEVWSSSVLHQQHQQGPDLARCAGGLGLNWVIIGGESGHNSRPCNVAWIRSVKDQCKAAEVPVFVKQLGAMPIGGKRMTPQEWRLRDPKGGDWLEWPEDLRVREFPKAPSP